MKKKTKQDKSSQKETFRGFLSEHFKDREKAYQEELEKAEQEKERRRQAVKKYELWKEAREPQAKEAAQQIFGWVRDFLTSESYQEILNFNQKVPEEEKIDLLRVSNLISYQRPSRYGGTQSYTQCFFLRLRDGQLFVQDVVKYGKKHGVGRTGSMLEWADPPVIIQAAEAIEDGRIWDIIKEGLETEFERG